MGLWKVFCSLSCAWWTAFTCYTEGHVAGLSPFCNNFSGDQHMSLLWGYWKGSSCTCSHWWSREKKGDKCII